MSKLNILYYEKTLKGVSRFLCVCQSPSCSSVLPAWKFPSLKWCFSFPCAYLYVHMFTPFSLFGWLNTRVARSWNANACYWWSKWMLKDVENKRRKRTSKWKIWCRTERKSIHSGLARRYTKYAKEIFFSLESFIMFCMFRIYIWCLFCDAYDRYDGITWNGIDTDSAKHLDARICLIFTVILFNLLFVPLIFVAHKFARVQCIKIWLL